MKTLPLAAVLLACACSSIRLGMPDRRAATERKMLRLAQAMERFRQDTGAYPKDAAQLSGYAAEDLLSDEWGHPYRIEPFPEGASGPGCRIVSAGEDGRFGTEDDCVHVHRGR